MVTLREAAQQALEALEEQYSGPLRDKAMDALRAALAEPVQPVAWMCPDDPERETAFNWKAGHCENCGKQRVPLYAAPPQRKPLTDEQVRDLWSWSMTPEAERTATTQQHAFARAIEAAHGIGDSNGS